MSKAKGYFMNLCVILYTEKSFVAKTRNSTRSAEPSHQESLVEIIVVVIDNDEPLVFRKPSGNEACPLSRMPTFQAAYVSDLIVGLTKQVSIMSRKPEDWQVLVMSLQPVGVFTCNLRFADVVLVVLLPIPASQGNSPYPCWS